MRTRRLGTTDLELSTVGLGTWPMGSIYGGMSWGPQDDQESVETILRAIDRGINWLDTAPTYGRGHSEEVVGMALKKMARRPIIVTKCGSTWTEDLKPAFRLDRADVRRQCEGSLKRMGIEVIGHFTTVFFQQYPADRKNGLRLIPVKPRTADIRLQLRHGCFGIILRLAVLPEQILRNDIHPLVRALG